MSSAIHPKDVLFQAERPIPALPVVDHYCGSEKLIRKALALQASMAGPGSALFDVTCDCEDGAPAGREAEHAAMCADLIMSDDNRYGRVGARIHDVTHAHWRADLEILIPRAGKRLPFVTLPKARSAADVRVQLACLRELETKAGLPATIPLHVLIETHGALAEVQQIAAIEGVESIDFGLMDFVSAHHGAIPGSAMQSPGQFEHPLVVRAKCEISAAALAHGVVPAHNVTTELSDTAAIYADARRARQQFGYLRMWSIHPNQITPILEAMRPDGSEVEIAADILCAAQDASWGPIRHLGKLHDRASYRYYWELLERARATGMALPDIAAQRFF
ncbi:MAG: CoA ester lyase [Rhodocyclaceae bacterium]|nr:CoA ester lyase [Rhodocyclaceae bacterium]MBX3668019.1 CoA ester lyase [Rhodocyclaceae bacterium]